MKIVYIRKCFILYSCIDNSIFLTAHVYVMNIRKTEAVNICFIGGSWGGVMQGWKGRGERGICREERGETTLCSAGRDGAGYGRAKLCSGGRGRVKRGGQNSMCEAGWGRERSRVVGGVASWQDKAGRNETVVRGKWRGKAI